MAQFFFDSQCIDTLYSSVVSIGLYVSHVSFVLDLDVANLLTDISALLLLEIIPVSDVLDLFSLYMW